MHAFWAERVGALAPTPFAADAETILAWAANLPDRLDSYWVSDGLDAPYRAGLTENLQSRGALTVFETSRPVIALAPAQPA